MIQGKRIVVTRASHQASELCALLEQHGALPLLYPCIDIAPPINPQPLDNALSLAVRGKFDWVVLTSSNTVLMLAQRLKALGSLTLNGIATAAIGSATAQAAAIHLNLQTQIIPDAFVAESLVAALGVIEGQAILLPQSAKARPTLADQLRQGGAHVTSVVAYQNILGHGGIDLPQLLVNQAIDAITFTSSSTVENCLIRLGNEGGYPQQLNRLCIACIGHITAQTAQAHGLTVTLTPNEHTLAGLVNELEHYFT